MSAKLTAAERRRVAAAKGFLAVLACLVVLLSAWQAVASGGPWSAVGLWREGGEMQVSTQAARSLREAAVNRELFSTEGFEWIGFSLDPVVMELASTLTVEQAAERMDRELVQRGWEPCGGILTVRMYTREEAELWPGRDASHVMVRTGALAEGESSVVVEVV